jgi:hypothetical protein
MAAEVKTAKNSKLPKLSKNYFEPVGKCGWPSISIYIMQALTYGFNSLAICDMYFKKQSDDRCLKCNTSSSNSKRICIMGLIIDFIGEPQARLS